MTKRSLNLNTPGINARTLILASANALGEAIRKKRVGHIVALGYDEKSGEIHLILADREMKMEDKRGLPKAEVENLTILALVESDGSTGAFNAATEQFGPLAQQVVDTIRTEVLNPTGTRSLMLVTDGRPTKNYVGFNTAKATCIDELGVKYARLPTNASCILGAKGKDLVTLTIEALRTGDHKAWKTVAGFDQPIIDLPVIRHRFNNAFIATETSLDAVDLTALGDGKATIITSEKFPTNLKVKVVGDIDVDTVLAYAWRNGTGRYLPVTTPRSDTAPHRLTAINKAAQQALGA